MGGANGGECASNIATDLIPQIYAEGGIDPPTALAHALEAANQSIYKKSRSDEELSGMGTTCVAVALTPKQVWVAWVGDSRVYLIRDGKLFQMTEDHSLVAGMVREGLITSEEASCHQDRHVLTKALGTHPNVEVAVWQESMPVRLGDRFLLCSDGLHDLLTEQDLLDLSGHGSVANAALELVQKAHELGGPDNISAVLLEVGIRAIANEALIAV
jgi:serine/threonine protein phosphatase PrpC